MAKLFGDNKVNVIDMNQALEALHKNGNSRDPIGTVIWMDVDDSGNVKSSSKQYPQMTPIQKLGTQMVTVPPKSKHLAYPYPTSDDYMKSSGDGEWIFTVALILLVVGISVACGWFGWQAVVERASWNGWAL